MDTAEKAKDADIKRLLGRGVAEVIIEEEMVELLRSGLMPWRKGGSRWNR